MRRFVRLTMIATILIAAAVSGVRSPGAADRFLSGIDDLPLMPGLEEQADAAMVFDTPAGRIVEAGAAGPVEPTSVRAFYRRTLPQLGWRNAGPDTFRREGEVLRFEVTGHGTHGTAVRFELAPAATKPGR